MAHRSLRIAPHSQHSLPFSKENINNQCQRWSLSCLEGSSDDVVMCEIRCLSEIVLYLFHVSSAENGRIPPHSNAIRAVVASPFTFSIDRATDASGTTENITKPYIRTCLAFYSVYAIIYPFPQIRIYWTFVELIFWTLPLQPRTAIKCRSLSLWRFPKPHETRHFRAKLSVI